MDIQLFRGSLAPFTSLTLDASKSESNRWLIIQAMRPGIRLQNLSPADDVQAMHRALLTATDAINIHHAGTAMRFLTAYLALHTHKSWVLTGSERMQQRPIHPLVDALHLIGAKVSYLGEEGFPPLRITGSTPQSFVWTINGSVSSQYVSALLLAAAGMHDTVHIKLLGEITSRPYIEMTLKTIAYAGGAYSWENDTIHVTPIPVNQQAAITVESDWSSASYWYSWVALSQLGTRVQLAHFNAESWQGDAILQQLYEEVGVQTQFVGTHMIIEKTAHPTLTQWRLDLADSPDLAQTIAVTAAGLGIGCQLTGLHTLRVKETDRLAALQTELGKLGVQVTCTAASLTFEATATLNNGVTISTYQDHRMAMAFAPLASRVAIVIQEAEVVSKSYVGFWDDLRQAGIQMHIG